MSERVSIFVCSEASELLWTRERRSSDETRLSFFGVAFRLSAPDLGNAVVDDFNNQRAARIGLEHDIGWFDIAMNDAARFRRRQCARGLLNHFKCQGQAALDLRDEPWPRAFRPRPIP